MANFTKSFHTINNEELVQLLKDVAAVLRKSESSVIERYAGISEISRFKNSQNVGVLTIGLFDNNSQIRELAANTLKQDYQLGETSDIVLELLENDADKLKNTIQNKDEQTFSMLISKMEKLHRKRSSFGTTKVEYGSRHLLTIFTQLGLWVKKIQGNSINNTSAHYLKNLLEKDNDNNSLKIIKKCLESKDVFCRRCAILLIGELNLDVDKSKQAFDLIIEKIDSDDNRNDYLVTWDGIQALTAIVRQNPKFKSRFSQIISDYFESRTYELDDKEASKKHCYHTKQHCVEALGSLFYYQELNKLLKIKNSTLFDLMSADNLRAISAVKEAVVNGFINIYYYQNSSSNRKLKLQQKKILNKLIYWVNSKNRYVSQVVHNFFTELPSVDHLLLVCEYLQQYIEHNYKNVAGLLANLQIPSLSEQDYEQTKEKLVKLLEKRKNLATVLGIIYARINQLSENEREELQQEHLATILVNCCLQPIVNRDEERLEENLKPALKELLWTLYELGRNIPNNPLLSIEQIQELRYLEDDDSCRLVLALFRARNSGEILSEQLKQLEPIAIGNDKNLVKVCVEIEQKIKRKGEGDSFTSVAVKYIPKNLGKSKGIHPRLASPFIAVLAKMETEEATKIIKSLLESRDDSFKPLLIQLRESLCGYQCYQLRNELAKMLLQDLTRRYKNRENLRLNYLNLLAAGEYQKDKSNKDLKLQFPQPDIFRQRVIKGFRDIQSKFRKLELPVLFPKEMEGEQVDYCVAGLESMSDHTINTLLYKVDEIEGEEMEEKFLKTYLHQINDRKALVFLDRALTDVEIVKLILSRHQTDEKLVDVNINDSIIGKVERIADDDSGLWVDIGLYEYKYRNIFIQKSQMFAQKDEDEINWQEYAREIIGSILKFSINITIDTNSNKIKDLELSRREFWVNPLDNPRTNITIRGNLIDFDLNDQNNPSAIFQVVGINKTLKVTLEELSWRSDSEWIDNWQTELKKQESEEFEITYDIRFKHWSFRNNPPKEEHFLELLYENGQSQNSCDFVYVKKQQEGYIFEIKPGKLCYLPAERLLEINSKGDIDYSFFLSKSNLKPGTRLKKVTFHKDTTLSSKPEVILKVKESQVIPVTEDILPIGMRIFGILKDLEDLNQNLPQGIEIKKKNKGKLEPSPEEQPPGHNLSDYCIEIEGLSPEIKSGDEVSGQIIEVKKYDKKLILRYLEDTFDAIEVGKSYQCRVVRNPTSEHNNLSLRHNNISGLIYENNITYGHHQLLPYFQKNMNLVARLIDKKEGKPRTVSLRVDTKVIRELGLEEEHSNGGIIISREQDVIIFEGKDHKTVPFALQDFKVENNGKIPYINEGDRIDFKKTSSHTLEMTLEAPLAFFSIRPKTDDGEKWSSWQDVMEIDHSYKCIYVAKHKQKYLLEYHPENPRSQPVFFALPVHFVNEIRQINALHTGDYLTLRCNSDESVSLEKFEPSPLHFAATPQIKISEISWIKDSTLTNNQDKIIIVAKIINTNYHNGVRIELQYLCFKDDDKSIPLVKGITGFYRFSEEERLRKGDFTKDNEIKVILAEPPKLREEKLWLTVENSNYIQEIQSDYDINILQDKLKQIREKWLENRELYTVKGTIVKYVETEGAFQISLDEISNNLQNYCWLPVDEVSASLVHSYNSIEDFGDERQKKFTIINIFPDDDSPEMEVSLILSYPILNIEEAMAEFDWSDGTILKLATFLEYQNFLEENHDLEEVSNKKVQLISIEVKPGVIVSIPVERFFVEGLEYESGGKEFGLQRGDQITLRMKVDNKTNNYNFDVIKFVRAEFNLLSDRHKIVYGEIKDCTQDKEIQLKLQGYSKVKCLLHPDFIQDKKELSKEEDLLFRVSSFQNENQDTFQNENQHYDQKQNNKLYFKPIKEQDLKKGDRLKVRYKKMEGNPPNRLRVIFGKNHQGYINRFEITYRLGFELSQFDVEEDDYFNAVVKQDVSETSQVRLSLKNPPIRGINYFLNQDYGKTIKAVIIKNNHQKNNLDIEVEPNIWVRVPYTKFSGINKPENDLSPGNVLLFQVNFNKRESQINLKLEDIEENNLLRKHLIRGMLVSAQLNNKVYLPKKELFSWEYFLPDYGNVEAQLVTKDGFKQDADYEMLLKLDYIPDDRSKPIKLKDRSPQDPQQRLYVDSPISGDRITMLGGDGKVVYLYSYYATYRINNRITYLRKQLQPAQIVVATRIEKDSKQQVSLRYDRDDEKRFNKPFPLTYLRQFLQQKQRYSNDLELTYIRCEGKEQIFEFQPGKLILIPASSLYFYGCSLDENQFKRFLPGDIFTVKLEIPSLEDLEQLQVKIIKIELSILHNLQRNQIIEAEVKEVIHEASGIVIKAKHLELEQFVRNLLRKSVYDYKVGQSIWLIVEYCNHQEQIITLKEIPDNFSRDHVLNQVKEKQKSNESQPKKRVYPYFAYAKINHNHQNRRDSPNSINLTLEIPQTKNENENINVNIKSDDILWSDEAQNCTIDDILVPNQQGIWVSIHKNSHHDLYVQTKTIRKKQVEILSSQLKYQPFTVIQAQVLKYNQNNNGAVGTVLLDVDGVQILIAHKNLIQGAQNKPCVESGMWVPVCLERAEYDTAKNNKSLSVISPNVSELNKLLLNKDFKDFNANVCYTLEHGLVFIYKQTLGYIPNENLTWSLNAKAADMFTPGDTIKVYRNKDKNNTFSLKHRTQFQDINIEQEIEAQIHRKINDSLYLKIKNTNIFILLTLHQDNFDLEEEQIVLRLVDINNPRMLADFISSDGMITSTLVEVSRATEESVRQMLDCYYMTAFKSIDERWQKIIDSLGKSNQNHNPISSLIELLENCKIPCTYPNIRKIITRLINKSYSEIIWTYLTDYQPDNDILYILCQIARKFNGKQLLTNRPELDKFIYYALGIVPIIDQKQNTVTPIQALENLLYAYQLDKSIDTQIALLIIYDQSRYFKLRRSILKQIITDISQNLNWLFKLPLPLNIDVYCYPRFQKINIPGVNQTLEQFAKSIKAIRDDYIYNGQIKTAEKKFQDELNKIRIHRINMPELALNIAICRTVQNDWQGSLNYLQQAAETLNQKENRDRFSTARQAYYQLAIYANYQLGRFSQLQNLIDKAFQENLNYYWLETLLAYIFFTTGKYYLSQQIIEHRKQPSILKKNVNALEHILLDFYWQDTKLDQPTDLKRINNLLQIFKQEKQVNSWIQPILNIRLLPNPQSQKTINFEKKVTYGKQYDVPEYALQQYYQKPAQVKLAKNKETVQNLVEIALSLNKLEDAQNILMQQKDAELNIQFYQDFLLTNQLSHFLENKSQANQLEAFDSFRNILLNLEEIVSNLTEVTEDDKFVPARDEYSGFMVMQLIQRWIKSPYNHKFIGQKLINLFKENPALRNLCWNREDLRTLIWHLIDRSHDYASIIDLIPTYLNQNVSQKQNSSAIITSLIVLEEHNFVNQNTMLYEVIQDINLSNKENYESDDKLQLLLPTLRELDHNYRKLAEKIKLLNQGFSQLNQNT